MTLERIAFNPVSWEDLRSKLIQSYFEHFISHAAVDFQNSPTSHYGLVRAIPNTFLFTCRVVSKSTVESKILEGPREFILA